MKITSNENINDFNFLQNIMFTEIFLKSESYYVLRILTPFYLLIAFIILSKLSGNILLLYFGLIFTLLIFLLFKRLIFEFNMILAKNSFKDKKKDNVAINIIEDNLSISEKNTQFQIKINSIPIIIKGEERIVILLNEMSGFCLSNKNVIEGNYEVFEKELIQSLTYGIDNGYFRKENDKIINNKIPLIEKKVVIYQLLKK